MAAPSRRALMARSWRPLVAFYWLAYLARQIAIAFRLRIDYNDAFDYLRNARRLAGDDVGYGLYHAPLTAALHAPLQLFLNGGVAALVAPHLFQAALSAALLFLFFRYLRLTFSPEIAHLGTVLLSLNRLVVHYFVPVMSEIPCALAVVTALYLLERRRRAAALALACGALARWNLLIWPAGLLAYDLVFRPKAARARWPVYFGALALWGGGCVLIYAHATKSDLWTTVRGVAEVMRIGSAEVSEAARAHEARWKDPLWLWMSAGTAVTLLALAGLWRARRDADCRFHAVQLLFLGGAASLAVGHREPRYLLPLLPFVYFLAAAGLEGLWNKFPKLSFIPAFAGVLLLCGFGAAAEIKKYADPVYADPILLELAEATRRPGARVYWEGEACSLTPQEHEFSYEDWGYYVYDVPSLASLAYLLREHLIPVGADGAPAPRDGDLLVRAPARILRENPKIPPTALEVLEYSGAALKPLRVIGNFGP